jgi:hypothetical protein
MRILFPAKYGTSVVVGGTGAFVRDMRFEGWAVSEKLKLAGLGGVVLVSGCASTKGGGAMAADDDFYFVQLSDTHWGFEGAAVNPDAKGTLKKAVAAVNGMARPPDFVMFTGDLTHTTDDPRERRQRMTEFKEIVGALKVKDVRFMPGEHDASLDNGKAFKEFFGATHYTFDHKGVHFIALDNVSRAKPEVGPERIAWLERDLSRFAKTTPVVVFTHRPLFDLKPDWEWFTSDGDAVMKVLAPFENVTVLYGHIHREDVRELGHAYHCAARSLAFAFPDPARTPEKKPMPFDKERPFQGLGVRAVRAGPGAAPTGRTLQLDEVELTLRELSGTEGSQQLLRPTSL